MTLHNSTSTPTRIPISIPIARQEMKVIANGIKSSSEEKVLVLVDKGEITYCLRAISS